MLATVVSGEHDVHFLIATSNRMQKGYGKFSCASNCCCFNRKMHKVPFVGDLDDSQPRGGNVCLQFHAETRELLILFQGMWWPNT
jgi:hypothetical protein